MAKRKKPAKKKKAAKRSTSRKKATPKSKKAPARKARAKVKPRASDKPRTKSEIYRDIADTTGMSRKEIVAVFEGLNDLIGKDVSKRGPGVFTIPGLVKLQTVRKPATKARKGINPFTGEQTIFKAKPARTVVKARPLKALKDMV